MKKILSLFLASALVTLGILTFAQPQAAEAATGGVGHVVIVGDGAGTCTNNGLDQIVDVADGGVGTGGTIQVDVVGGSVTNIDRIVSTGSGYVDTNPATIDGVTAVLGCVTPATVNLSITNGVGGVTINNAGSGYSPADVITITGGGANATLTVNTIGGSGEVATFTLTTNGTGYADATNVATTVAPAGGTGFTVDITILYASSPGAVSDTIVVTQNVTSEITMTAAPDVAMSPDIPGMTGGTSNGGTSWTIRTNDTSGYNMTVASTTNPTLASAGDDFADYTDGLPGSITYADWTVVAANSAFGFTIDNITDATSVAQPFLDNNTLCNFSGGTWTAAEDKCWSGISNTNPPLMVVNRLTDTVIGGEQVDLKFRATVGASHFQEEGAYTATIVVTAATN